MAVAFDIGTLIDRNPRIRGGKAKIAGTGITVMRIAIWHRLGRSPEEIVLSYEHLSLAQIHAALTYYHANREEIDGEIAEEEALFDVMERKMERDLPIP